MALITLHTEEELISMISSGNKDCFDYIYDQYATPLYTTILKIVKTEEVACAVLQNTFVKIWQQSNEPMVGKQKLYMWMLQNARLAIAEVMQTAKTTGNHAVTVKQDMSGAA